MKPLMLTTCLALSCLISACNSNPSLPTPPPSQTPTPLPQPPMAGGYAAVDVNDIEVQNAAQFAAQAIGNLLNRVIKAERQVVAGMNYRLQLDLQNGAEYEVVVYVDLQNQRSLSSSRQLKAGVAPAPTCPSGERWSTLKNGCLLPMRTSPDKQHQCIADEHYFDVDTNTCKKLFN